MMAYLAPTIAFCVALLAGRAILRLVPGRPAGAAPRLGSLAVGLGLLAGGAWPGLAGSSLWAILLVSAVPAVTAGLCEDVTGRVSVRVRLVATIASGLLFAALSGYRLEQLGIPGVDTLLAYRGAALLFTAIAIGGVANAFNIIDGCNGLASGTAMVLLVSFALIARDVGDIPLMALSLTTLAAIAGFFMLNFPHGRIFLGDAGAYLVGFLLAALAVALPARHAGLSPVIGLLVLVYPVSETLYSILRRWRSRKGAISQPDHKHLHSLVFRALDRVIADRTRRNSASAALLWGLPLLSGTMAVALARSSTLTVLAVVALNALLYHVAYVLIRRRLQGRTRAPGRILPMPAPPEAPTPAPTPAE